MRAWRSPQGFVVDRGPSAQGVVSSLAAELPEGPWRALHEYVLVDAGGVVRRSFTVSVWSIDDELGVSVFAVVDGALRELRVSTFHGHRYRVERREEIVVAGLHEITADDADAEARRFLDRALDGERRRLAQEAARRDREAEARVAAIAGAVDDLGAGPDFERAQAALRGRVASYGDERAGDLLRALVRFGGLRRAWRPAGLAGALDAFVTACRLAAFDRSLALPGEEPRPSPPLAGALPALAGENRTEARALAELLGSLEQGLLGDAEGQAWADANTNAAQLRRAAAYVALARERLEEGIRTR